MVKKISKEDIFDAALKGIYRQGYKATTMRAIAADIGVEAPTIYNYVSGKHDLLEKLLFDIADRFLEGVQHIDNSSYSPLEKIKQFISLNIELSRRFPYNVSLLTNEWRHLNDDKRKKFLKHRSKYEKLVEKLIIEAMENGDLQTMEIEILKNSILSTVRWIFSWIPENAEKINPVELEKQIVDIVLRGIAK